MRGLRIKEAERNFVVAVVIADTRELWFDRDANAALIAAAPELYEALEAYVEHIEPYLMKAVEAGYDNTPHVHLLNGAKRALAKAKGEA